jgi:hypothetical protein
VNLWFTDGLTGKSPQGVFPKITLYKRKPPRGFVGVFWRQTCYFEGSTPWGNMEYRIVVSPLSSPLFIPVGIGVILGNTPWGHIPVWRSWMWQPRGPGEKRRRWPKKDNSAWRKIFLNPIEEQRMRKEARRVLEELSEKADRKDAKGEY